MEITYRKHEDFCVPNLLMHGSEPAAYGRFGRMRLKYLKEHRRGTYTTLKTSGQLTHHLNEIDREANQMLRLLIEQMAQAQGITEQLKSKNQIAWVGAMNNIRSAAEEQGCCDLQCWLFKPLPAILPEAVFCLFRCTLTVQSGE